MVMMDALEYQVSCHEFQVAMQICKDLHQAVVLFAGCSEVQESKVRPSRSTDQSSCVGGDLCKLRRRIDGMVPNGPRARSP